MMHVWSVSRFETVWSQHVKSASVGPSSSEDMLLMVQVGRQASHEEKRSLECAREGAHIQEGMPEVPHSMGIPRDGGG